MKKIYTPLAAFILFTSCSGIINTTAVYPEDIKKGTAVLRIHTNEHGLIYFSKKYPGKIVNDEIAGVKQVPLELFRSDSISYRVMKGKEKPIYVFSNGNKLEVFKYNNMQMVYTSNLIRVPIEEVSLLEFRKEPGYTVILSGLVLGVSAFCIYVISNLSFPIGDQF